MSALAIVPLFIVTALAEIGTARVMGHVRVRRFSIGRGMRQVPLAAGQASPR
jgi:hypothetical protein